MPDPARGIVVDGQVLTGTEFVLREADAWWDPADADDRYQLRPRADRVDILCGHWTAGEAGTKTNEDDGRRVVSVMKRRKSRKRPGRRLKVSVQFVIGACGPDDDYAPVWQTMDLGGRFAATHVGRGSINARSIGVEVVSAGLDGAANVRDREEIEVELLGRKREVLAFYPGQLRAWVRLANALAGKCLPGGIEIPKHIPAQLLEDGSTRVLPRRFTTKELGAWSGAMEHYLMDNTRKVDAGTLLLDALLSDGWMQVDP